MKHYKLQPYLLEGDSLHFKLGKKVVGYIMKRLEDQKPYPSRYVAIRADGKCQIFMDYSEAKQFLCE